MRNFSVLALLVCVFCVAVVLSVKPSGDDDSVAEENDWKNFKSKNNRKYSPAEEGKRRGHFKKNRKVILAHNKKFAEGKSTYKVKINQFADSSLEEMQALKGFIMPNEGLYSIPVQRVRRQVTAVPDSKDWRTAGILPPVQHQGYNCGTCWMFSATGALDALYAIKYGSVKKLSEQYYMDCLSGSTYVSCKGGWMGSFYYNLKLSGKGLPESSVYPYVAQKETCRNGTTYNHYAPISGYVKTPTGDEEELKRVVGTIGPVAFAMNAQEIEFMYYESGVFDGIECSTDTSKINHAMIIVGYGTDANGIDYWIIRNSWGSGWGEGGYTKVIRNKGNRCGVASWAIYPIIA